MESVIADFKKSIYYRQLLNRYGDKTVIIYIGGSRAHNLETPFSDYDVTILVDDDIPYESSMPHCFLQYKDTLVHWYYVPIKTLLSSTLTQDLYDLMMPTTLRVPVDNPSSVLYFNDKYSKVLETIIAAFNKLSKDWYAFIFNTYEEAIQRYVLGKPLKPGDKKLSGKKIYFLCLCSCLIRDVAPNKDFLTELKLAKRTRNLSNECRNYIKESLIAYGASARYYQNDLHNMIKLAEDRISDELRNIY